MKKVTQTLLFLISILICTSCGHISTEKSVQKYLKRLYPNEEFTISHYNKVKLEGDVGGCDNANGNTWIVKSKDTNITFFVQDDYIFNSFTCEYSLIDNYFDVYLTKTIEKMNDPKIKVENVTDVVEKGAGYLPRIFSIDLALNDFNSKEELASFMVDVRSKLATDSRIKEELLDGYGSFWFDIYDDDKVIYNINFYLSDNVDYILEEINKKDAKNNTKEDNVNNDSVLKITINNNEYEATIEDSETAKSFIALLPKTFSMQELNGNEKYIYMDNSLPSNPVKPEHIQSGDIMLFGDNCLVIFYKSFDTNYSYTKIGHITNLPDLGNGNITATFKK